MSRIVLSLMMIIGMMFPIASDSPAAEDDFGYVINNGTATILNYYGNDTDLVIPSKLGGYPVTAIGKFILDINESNVDQITIPDEVLTIAPGAFATYNSIEKILVSAHNPAFTSVDGVLFNKAMTRLKCYPSSIDIEHYKIPESVESVDDFAFFGCSKLTRVSIPKYLNSLGSNPFNFCNNLESFTVDNENRKYMDKSDALFDISTNTLLKYPPNNDARYYSIPNSIETIASSAFAYARNLETVVIPSTVKTIESYAFESCDGLSTALFLGNPPDGLDSTVFCVDFDSGSYQLDVVLYFLPEYSNGWTENSGEYWIDYPIALWNNNPFKKDVLSAYHEFLASNSEVPDSQEYANSILRTDAYALFDMNSDDVPELIIAEDNGYAIPDYHTDPVSTIDGMRTELEKYAIYTYQNGKVVLLDGSYVDNVDYLFIGTIDNRIIYNMGHGTSGAVSYFFLIYDDYALSQVHLSSRPWSGYDEPAEYWIQEYGFVSPEQYEQTLNSILSRGPNDVLHFRRNTAQNRAFDFTISESDGGSSGTAGGFSDGGSGGTAGGFSFGGSSGTAGGFSDGSSGGTAGGFSDGSSGGTAGGFSDGGSGGTAGGFSDGGSGGTAGGSVWVFVISGLLVVLLAGVIIIVLVLHSKKKAYISNRNKKESNSNKRTRQNYIESNQFCINCGTELNGHTFFCPWCGSNVDRTTSSQKH